jgi:toxin ParE1/3/4
VTRQCILSSGASRDLELIFDYFLERSIDAGEAFIVQFNRKCRNIASFPNMGRLYPDLGATVRGVPLDDYIILYRVTEDEIVLVRVVSGYQNLDNLSLGDDLPSGE